MFHNLIESGSHSRDLKRKSSFFLGTLVFYVVLLMMAGVGSIYAYNVRLDDGPNIDVTILRFAPAPAPAPEMPARLEEIRSTAARSNAAARIATAPEFSVNTPYHSDRIASASAREVRPTERVAISPHTSDAIETGGIIGPPRPGNLYGHTPNGGVVVPRDETEEAPTMPRVKPQPTPAAAQKPVPLASSVLSGKTIAKPAPAYPQLAITLRLQGAVTVQIVVDEQGRVISAHPTSGPAILQAAAMQAAYRARFTPTLLTGQPVKVSGVITYNFVLQ